MTFQSRKSRGVSHEYNPCVTLPRRSGSVSAVFYLSCMRVTCFTGLAIDFDRCHSICVALWSTSMPKRPPAFLSSWMTYSPGDAW